MSSQWANQPVAYERVDRSGLAALVSSIELDPDHVDRFLGPLDEIVTAVQAGLAHAMVSIRTDAGVIGYYVLHPDRRDSACWWLGWLALDRRVQGCGLGRRCMARIMAEFRRMPGCRRARLLVARDNCGALRLYERAGFQEVGVDGRTGELILEAILPGPVAACRLLAGLIRICCKPGHLSHPGRLRLSAGPFAARVIGVERAPPMRTGVGARSSPLSRASAARLGRKHVRPLVHHVARVAAHPFPLDRMRLARR